MNNQSIEQIYDKALEELAQGRLKTEILSKYPAIPELEGLLDLSLALSAMPKKEIPEPSMQRKYILAPARRVWLQWVHISRFAAVSTSALLLAALVGGTGYATNISKPGELLFQVKKATEHLQLQLTTNPQSKLSLQIEIAQKRLDDAQAALNNSQEDPQKKTAALNELAQETKNTVDVLTQATGDKSANLSSAQDRPLIASLKTITAKQQTLLKNIASEPQTNIDQRALSAAQENVTKVAAIQKSLEAASNEQTLAALPSNPAAVIATGSITSLTNDSITVGKNTFSTSDKTIVKNISNTTVKFSDLLPQDQVIITGDKTDNGLLAGQITVLTKASTTAGSVKGALTQQPSASSTKLSKEEPAAATSNFETIPDPNIATAGIIAEPAAPQTDFSR